MFRISIQQASTKGMMHCLEHSSNCATVLFICIIIKHDLYIMMLYILCTYIQKDVLHCLPVHVFTPSQVTCILSIPSHPIFSFDPSPEIGLHGRGLLALASVGRCCEAVSTERSRG